MESKVTFSSFQPVCILASLSKVAHPPIQCTLLTFSLEYWQTDFKREKNRDYFNFKLLLKDYYLNTKLAHKNEIHI